MILLVVQPKAFIMTFGDAETFGFSRQKFQGILARLEILQSELEFEPELSREVIKKNLDAIISR